ncbi:tigger transposable element-derived protein 6 [Plakobranchus ocellatus]|uniref:Tigger transposable element-derived protein 6 n=1 Tax=Plakobranchus ocellatus TaxID=259542 RepID=A0AAV4BIV2_9GAST|nr:tigger transposable element-derived protein 6 [Plakobranchus ocellatus]
MGKTQTKKEIAEKYGIPANTLSTILKNREKLEKMASTSAVNLGKKRIWPNKVEDVDEGLLTWFKQARALGAPINGPILMEKAGEPGKGLDISFVPCSGWLGRFKRRHGIVFKAPSGEAASVDMSTVDTWRGSALQQLLENYNADNIFNANETGIFYKCLPDKTLDFKRNVCTGGKKSKGSAHCISSGQHELNILQPCDQGIINSIKRKYRKAVVQRYQVHIDTRCPATFNISVLEALYLMKKAWDDISTSAVANCFRHTGFHSQEESSETESETSQENRDLVPL